MRTESALQSIYTYASGCGYYAQYSRYSNAEGDFHAHCTHRYETRSDALSAAVCMARLLRKQGLVRPGTDFTLTGAP